MHNGDEITPVMHAKDALEIDDPHGASPPPDGGFQAWTVVAGSFQLKNYSASTIAWITSFEVFIMFLGVCTPYSLPTWQSSEADATRGPS